VAGTVSAVVLALRMWPRETHQPRERKTPAPSTKKRKLRTVRRGEKEAAQSAPEPLRRIQGDGDAIKNANSPGKKEEAVEERGRREGKWD